jgi:hypothetical protein
MAGLAPLRSAVAPTSRVGLLSRLLRSARDVVEPANAPAVAAVAAPAPRAAPVSTPHHVEMTWPSLLLRCWEAVKADCVFAVSQEGLILGGVGSLTRKEVERVAAHLSRAFDLLDEVKSAGRVTEALCVRYAPEGRWLTAVRIAPVPGAVITIGVIGRHTLIEHDRQRLRNTFLRLFEDR